MHVVMVVQMRVMIVVFVVNALLGGTKISIDKVNTTPINFSSQTHTSILLYPSGFRVLGPRSSKHWASKMQVRYT